MTIRKVTRRGEPRLVIDIVYKKVDGTKGRYRHDASVQIMAAARAEERRLLAHLAVHGDLTETVEVASVAAMMPTTMEVQPQQLSRASATASSTFAQAVDDFRRGKAITGLKSSTRDGYEAILSSRLLSRFGDTSLDEITFEQIKKLDAEHVVEGLSTSRRRNIQIVVRSILRAAVDDGKLAAMPKLPTLPKKGRKVLVSLSEEQVDRILEVSAPSQRLAFALAAYAGLRAGEVRALRWVDVDLEGGLLVIRYSEFKGELSTPKSGHQREIPLAPQLLAMLQAIRPRKRKECGRVSTSNGQPWRQNGLYQAFKRTVTKAGLVGAWRFHDLRHFFVTHLFRRGGSAPAIQALAGHLHLATTQRYAHVVQADLRKTIGLFTR